MDKNLVLSLLSEIEDLLKLEELEDDSLLKIENELNIIFNTINKKQLIEKFIQLNADSYKEIIKINKENYKHLFDLILKAGLIYLNNFNDPLYLIAQVSIAIDYLLYDSINLVV